MSTGADSSSHSNPSARSHATAWTFALLLALPLLYLLSVPPVVIFTLKPRGSLPFPRFLKLYTTPYDWLHDHTPLEDPLHDYFGWWSKKTDYYLIRVDKGNAHLFIHPPPP